MPDYRDQKPATEAPVLPLSAQMRIAAEMAAPEISGLAHLIGTKWQAEALRLEASVAGLREIAEAADIAHTTLANMGVEPFASARR